MKNRQTLLNKIVQYLILYTSSMNDLGLLSGKMGVCIFFYRYARHTATKRYADFAGELLDEIYEEINTGISRDFGKGLAGICWGIEYLAHQGFVDADADEVLREMDHLIMERDVRRMTDIALDTGLEGLANYALARCAGKQKLPLDIQYIAELTRNMETRVCAPELAAQLSSLLRGEKIDYGLDLIDIIATHGKYQATMPLKEQDLGISKNGLAGTVLRMINEQTK